MGELREMKNHTIRIQDQINITESEEKRRWVKLVRRVNCTVGFT